MTIWDKRRPKRRVPRTVAFVQFDQDKGAKLLDVSEGGLGFELPSPMLLKDSIHFWFSLDLSERIEATGKLVWADVTSKKGGLKFISLGDEAREQLGRWMTASGEEESVDSTHLPTTVSTPPDSVEKSPQSPEISFSAKTDQQLHAGPSNEVETVWPQTEVQPEAQTNGASFETAQLISLQRHRSALRRQLVRGVLLGTLVTSLAATAVVRFTHRREQRAAVSSVAVQNTGTNLRTTNEASFPAPVADPGNRSASPAAKNTQRVTHSSYTPDNPQPSAIVPARQPSPFSSANPPISRPAQQLRTPDRVQKSTATPQQLWASVQSGNAKAAVALADLYIRGEGVPANCDQARVLLLVASEKRNAEAIKKLQQLDKTGCPAP